MDDPTKDLIPRSSIEYCLRKETVSTNPDEYEAHEKFIAYMDDPEISQFGRWMHSNGINVALTAIEVDLDKIPSAQPEIVRCKDCKWYGDIGCAVRIADDTDKPSEHDFCSFAERRDDGRSN